jgi:hypothetical protein
MSTLKDILKHKNLRFAAEKILQETGILSKTIDKQQI